MKLSDINVLRIRNTVSGTPDRIVNGVSGSKFFALLRAIRMFGVPIECAADSKLHGLKALEIAKNEWIAVRREVYTGGSSKCTWYLLDRN